MRARISTRSGATAATLLVSFALLVYAAAVLRGFTLKVTDDDQSLYWLMAQDVRHLRLHVPFVYGQAYNLAPEIYPSALLMALGRRPPFAVATTALATGFLAWAVLAVFAMRMERRAIALLLLMGPLLLPVAYTFELGRPENSGVLVATIALCALTLANPGRKGLAFGTLAALAYAVHANSLLLTVPATVYLVGRHYRDARLLVGLAVGAAAGLVALWLTIRAASLDPDWLIHASPAARLSLTLLRVGLRDPGTYFGRMVPWILPSAWALPGVLLLLAVVAWRRRELAAAAAILTSLAIIVASLGLTKAHDGDTGVFFAYARLYLAVPILLGFLVVITVPRLSLRRRHLGLAVGVAAVSLALQLSALPGQAAIYRPRSGVQGVTNARIAGPLFGRCQQVAALMKAEHTSVFVQLGDRGEAYACPALLPGSMQTYFPPYDRRGWVADDMRTIPQGRVLFSDFSDDLCSRAKAVGATCHVSDAVLNVGVIDLGGRTVAGFLRAVGIAVLEPASE